MHFYELSNILIAHRCTKYLVQNKHSSCETNYTVTLASLRPLQIMEIAIFWPILNLLNSCSVHVRGLEFTKTSNRDQETFKGPYKTFHAPTLY